MKAYPSSMMDIFLASAFLALLVYSAISVSISGFTPTRYRLPQKALRRADTSCAFCVSLRIAKLFRLSTTGILQACLPTSDRTLLDVRAFDGKCVYNSEEIGHPETGEIAETASQAVLRLFLDKSAQYLSVETSTNVFRSCETPCEFPSRRR